MKSRLLRRRFSASEGRSGVEGGNGGVGWEKKEKGGELWGGGELCRGKKARPCDPLLPKGKDRSSVERAFSWTGGSGEGRAFVQARNDAMFLRPPAQGTGVRLQRKKVNATFSKERASPEGILAQREIASGPPIEFFHLEGPRRKKRNTTYRGGTKEFFILEKLKAEPITP